MVRKSPTLEKNCEFELYICFELDLQLFLRIILTLIQYVANLTIREYICLQSSRIEVAEIKLLCF